MQSRLSVQVTGIVQGVGFRPFVYRLASRLGLSGWVKNNGSGVSIEAEGPAYKLTVFHRALTDEAPALAAVEQMIIQWKEPVGATGFVIAETDTSSVPRSLLSPDIATCEECRSELLNPADRRYRYPFINCTQCGPRYTIVRGLPYDRPATAMASFSLCPACRREYDNPTDRRFHAQPNACAICGPEYRLTLATGEAIKTDEPFGKVREAVAAGAIVAIKGVGAWHLACSAYHQAPVETLRLRKGRESKPFAVMAGSLAAVQQICRVSPEEAAMLTGRERPIVLLDKLRSYCLAETVAPHNLTVGVMLPYAPLHWLLLAPDDIWVMTSGNRAGEPAAIGDEEAMRQLADIADYYLIHNRSIERRADDSVVRVFSGQSLFIRRSRGFVPLPVKLAASAPAVLAVGGDTKNTFCLAHERQAFVSPHIGDLASQSEFDFFLETIAEYQQLFSITPELVVHDLHPGYWSSRYAAASGLPTLAVQHHHAHIAAVMAEHGLDEPVIGVALDGTGYGEDSAVWGGEFFVGGLGSFTRAAHFAYLPLPGGERAVQEPWRLAAWLLQEISAGRSDERHPDFTALLPKWWQTVTSLPAKGVHSPLTSSAGRLFDAAGALIGKTLYNHYEGQAAVELEYLAGKARADVLPYAVQDGNPMVIDFLPVFAAFLDRSLRDHPGKAAAAFHETMAHAVYTVAVRLMKTTGIKKVVLGGGVWQNARLLTTTVRYLTQAGVNVYLPRQMPINDGGLCLGQVAMATKRWSRYGEKETIPQSKMR